MKKSIILLLFFILYFYPNQNVSACTVMCVANSQQVFVGNNEDGTNLNAKAWIVPSDGKSYGYIAFGFDDAFAQGGMNDQGFFMDWATTTIQSLDSSDGQRFFKLKLFGFDFNEMILRNSANVEEAIELFKTFYLPEVNGHALLADKTGRSVIVEWKDGEIVVLPAINNVQFMTNFNLSHPAIEQTRDTRYINLENRLNPIDPDQNSFDLVLASLEATYQSGPNHTGTIYSNIYNLNTGDVYTIYMQNPNYSVKWNLHDELTKNENQLFDLKKMFAADTAYPEMKDRNSQNPFSTASMLQVFWVVGSLIVILLTVTTSSYFLNRYFRNKWATILFGVSLLNGLACLYFWKELVDSGRYIRFQLTVVDEILYRIPYIIVGLTVVQFFFLVVFWLSKQIRWLDRILYGIYTAIIVGLAYLSATWFITGITIA